jgi:hypothetical protein
MRFRCSSLTPGRGKTAGKVHKRSSTTHIYSHCVVIHFAADPPSKLWAKGVAACSHAEWVESCALAERKASRWRKEPCVEAVEILEARRAHDPPTTPSNH